MPATLSEFTSDTEYGVEVVESRLGKDILEHFDVYAIVFQLFDSRFNQREYRGGCKDEKASVSE